MWRSWAMKMWANRKKKLLSTYAVKHHNIQTPKRNASAELGPLCAPTTGHQITIFSNKFLKYFHKIHNSIISVHFFSHLIRPKWHFLPKIRYLFCFAAASVISNAQHVSIMNIFVGVALIICQTQHSHLWNKNKWRNFDGKDFNVTVGYSGKFTL